MTTRTTTARTAAARGTLAAGGQPKTISIDFDGVLMPDPDSPWRYEPEALDVAIIRECQARGYAVAISTCADVDQVADVLQARGIRCSVDRTLSRSSWHDGEVVLVTGRKVHAVVMLDDHAMLWRYGDDLVRLWRETERRSGYAWCPGPARRHWGPDGAAGILPWTIRRGELHVALAERSAAVHGGRCYSTVGGAIDPGESALQAALREAHEEISGLKDISVTDSPYVAACESCTWSYTTFPARVAGDGGRLPRIGVRQGQHQWETLSCRWYPADALPGGLHPGLASAWPELRRRIDASARA
jgi:8-oxo-dGTP diphosphatase